MPRSIFLSLLLGLLLALPCAGIAGRLDDKAAVSACASYYARLGAPVRVDFVAQGPKVILPAPASGTRDIRGIQELKIATYNVLNLEELKGKVAFDPAAKAVVRQSPSVAKPAWQLDGVADTIRRADPDILFLQEVESINALEALTRDRLGNAYRLLLVEGNDDRGIDIAVLVRNDLPFDLSLQSYRNEKMANGLNGNAEELTFSRDLPVVTIRERGEKTPLMDLVGVHFKSQRDRGSDTKGVYKRSEQVKAAARIVAGDAKGGRGGKSPVFILGDFNSDIASSPEFGPLWQLGFKDAFDLAGVPPAERVTQTYHLKGGQTVYSQLDAVAILGGDDLVKRAEVVPYLDASGKPKAPPATFEERELNPSDHRMVNVVLDFHRLYRRATAPFP